MKERERACVCMRERVCVCMRELRDRERDRHGSRYPGHETWVNLQKLRYKSNI